MTTYTVKPLVWQTSTNVFICAWCRKRIDGLGNPHSCKCMKGLDELNKGEE